MLGSSFVLNIVQINKQIFMVSYYTKEGLKKLAEEINYLKTFERPNISKQIAEAREKGDLSENAEYDAAKEAQGLLELKISKLEDEMNNARLIDPKQLDLSRVSVFANVKIRNLKNKAEVTYNIVNEKEADLKSGKISSSSPIAQGLLGKKIGDKVEIKVPAGMVTFEVVDIFM
jgi:transcription elongation factor GreA